METNSISSDGRVYSGPKAVGVFQAKVLRSSLSLYLKTGLKPTRGVGLKQMMILASSIVGTPFKASKKEIPNAIASLDLLISASEAALIDAKGD